MEKFEEIQPTKQETLNAKLSRMISIQAKLSGDDYKHSRQQREKQLNIALTLSEEEYTAFCLSQQIIVDEYNVLENECKELEPLIQKEQEEAMSFIE